MRFTRMENGLPKRENFKLKTIFKEFIAMDIKVARVDLDPDDYKNPAVARNVLGNAAKRHSVPVKVKISDGVVYFIRTDM